MNKKIVRLTESDLHKIIKESVRKVVNKAYGTSPQKDIKVANRVLYTYKNQLNSGAYF